MLEHGHGADWGLAMIEVGYTIDIPSWNLPLLTRFAIPLHTCKKHRENVLERRATIHIDDSKDPDVKSKCTEGAISIFAKIVVTPPS